MRDTQEERRTLVSYLVQQHEMRGWQRYEDGVLWYVRVRRSSDCELRDAGRSKVADSAWMRGV